MINVLRLALALVVLLVAAVASLASFAVEALRNHIMRTALLLMPVGGPAHRIFRKWVSHYCDGYCWKCGSRGPTAGDLGDEP